MNKFSLRLTAASLLALASAGTLAQSSGTEPLEITGAFQERTGPALQCPSQFGGTLAGHGNSPQLGRVVFIANDCITPNPPLFTFDQGRFVVVTLNGDQLHAQYSGQFVPTGQGTLYVFTGATFQITGGTGKYARATGGGTLSGNEDIVTGMGTLKLSGQITRKPK